MTAPRIDVPDVSLAALALVEAVDTGDTQARAAILASTDLADLICGLTRLAIGLRMYAATRDAITVAEVDAWIRGALVAQQGQPS